MKTAYADLPSPQFYILSVLVVGLIVRSDDARLLGSSTDPSTSPFVIAIKDAGLTGLDSVMNAVILISVLSVANSSFFGSSRTLAALAEQKQAPSILGYIDRKGRPIVAVLVAAAVGLLAYMGTGIPSDTTLKWLTAISGLSSNFTWARCVERCCFPLPFFPLLSSLFFFSSPSSFPSLFSSLFLVFPVSPNFSEHNCASRANVEVSDSICLAHIRLRKAWTARGYPLEKLVYRSPVGVWGSWVGFTALMMILVAQLWVAIDPIGEGSGESRASAFFSVYLAAPVVICFYVSFKLYYKTKWVPIGKIDLDTGRYRVRVYPKEDKKPFWRRVCDSLC